MKKVLYLLLAVILLTGCSTTDNKSKDATVNNESTNEKMVSVSDSSGNKLSVKTSPQKVIAVSSSMAEIWMFAGGNLIGVSEDALGERNLGLSEKDVEIIGTIKEPNTEKILAMQPDLVLLSQDITSHVELSRVLDEANIPYYMCKVENLNDYLFILRNFVSITTKEELYTTNGEDVKTGRTIAGITTKTR